MVKTKPATYWGPPMTDSERAVFHFDVKTMSARDAEGRESPASNTPLILDNQAEAERYSTEKVAGMPGLGCRIYDRDGHILGTFANPEVYEHFHGRPSAKRSLLVGTVLLVAGVGLISLDVWMGLRLILGVFLGVRFLWVAAVKLIDGVTGLRPSVKKF